jgi:hypothetical protein
MRRHADWPQRFQQFLINQREQPFQYGERDCCLFVADAVLAMTGNDLAASFRGKYRTRKEALVLIKDYAGKPSVEAVVEKVMQEHGLQEVLPSYAQRGDIVLVQRAKDYSLGIVDLNGKHVIAAAKKGYLRLDLSRATRAWRV